MFPVCPDYFCSFLLLDTFDDSFWHLPVKQLCLSAIADIQEASPFQVVTIR